MSPSKLDRSLDPEHSPEDADGVWRGNLIADILIIAFVLGLMLVATWLVIR